MMLLGMASVRANTKNGREQQNVKIVVLGYWRSELSFLPPDR